MALGANSCFGWTPQDTGYNLCQVVPSAAPRTSTGASSGPSIRCCRVFSLTRPRYRLSDKILTPGSGTALGSRPPTTPEAGVHAGQSLIVETVWTIARPGSP